MKTKLYLSSRDMISGAITPRQYQFDREKMERVVGQCSGFVKMMTGVANNCAIAIVRDAYDRIRGRGNDRNGQPRQAHPRYRHEVKRLARQFFTEWDAYERRLRLPASGETRFFHVADMPPEARRMYRMTRETAKAMSVPGGSPAGEKAAKQVRKTADRDMTDAEYFEFWQGTGALAYERSQPLIGSLHNKFRLSLQRHDVPHADTVAWAMVALSALELACDVWSRAMRSCKEAMDDEFPSLPANALSLEYLSSLWRVFSVRRPADTWRRFLSLLAPETDGYALDPDEERNIDLGLRQLQELWISKDLPYDATIQAVEDFQDDVFRTKGTAKKAIRQLAEMKQGTEEALNIEH